MGHVIWELNVLGYFDITEGNRPRFKGFIHRQFFYGAKEAQLVFARGRQYKIGRMTAGIAKGRTYRRIKSCSSNLICFSPDVPIWYLSLRILFIKSTFSPGLADLFKDKIR